MQNKIICVVGPTASGKTSLAIEIAKQVSGEIVCADSMQIYKYMDIATAKPTKEERAIVPHHMTDFLEPHEEFSVARYVQMADDIISDIISRGKVPVICGGTGLYVNSLIRGNDFCENTIENTELRQDLLNLCEREGNEYVHEMLKDIDPESYEKLHPNDYKRVVRAIEVYKTSGKTISQHNRETKDVKSKYDATVIAINTHDRQELYDRINLRVDLMVKNGLLEEFDSLLKAGYITKTAAQAIGYKELFCYQSGEKSLGECLEKIKQESRRYAKRQITWFKKTPNVHWIYDMNDKEQLLKKSLEIIEGN